MSLEWLDFPLTTSCYAWRLERADGVTIGFVSHDRDLVIDGLRYRAAPGMVPSTIALSDSLEMDSVDIAGVMTSTAMAEADLIAGRWNGAQLHIYLVNWESPEDEPLHLISGEFGEITRSGDAFRVEMLGGTSFLDEAIAPLTSPTCRARLGDRGCKVSLSDSPRLYAAAAGGLGWRQAQLFAVGADGVTADLIGDISAPARIGTAPEPLGASGPHLIDRQSALLVQMHNSNMHLNDADHAQLLAGQNIAAIGREIIQFGSAMPVGDDRYILSHLLRGLGGTEQEMGSHLGGEDFVLLDGVDLTEIDARHYAPFQLVMISAIGRGDDVPVSHSIDEPGRALKPWSPVHPRFAFQQNGDLEIRWTRRSRAGLMWQDHVEIPLAEETERYRVLIGNEIWSEPAVPVAIIPATDVQTYRDLGASSLSVAIRQIGQHHISDPLLFEMEI